MITPGLGLEFSWGSSVSRFSRSVPGPVRQPYRRRNIADQAA